jgi:hypothetical protein
MKIGIVTPTANRPHLLERCAYYLERTGILSDSDWVVVDGSIIPRKPKGCTRHIQTPPIADGAANFKNNMTVIASFLKLTSWDACFFIEDDDWYSPKYFTTLLPELDKAPLVGLCPSTYYHVVARGGRICPNLRHASLCNTAIRRDAFQKAARIIEQNKNYSYDIALFREIESSLIPTNGLSLGIKGCSFSGVTKKHENPAWLQFQDSDFSFLRNTVGEDFYFYEKLSLGWDPAKIKEQIKREVASAQRVELSRATKSKRTYVKKRKSV